MKTTLFNNKQWLIEKATGKKKISCADYAYLTNNGWIEKAFYGLCCLLGHSYKGSK